MLTLAHLYILLAVFVFFLSKTWQSILFIITTNNNKYILKVIIEICTTIPDVLVFISNLMI